MEPIQPNTTLTLTVAPEEENLRIDTFLAQHFSLYSRTFFQKLIDLGLVAINKKIITKHKSGVKDGDCITITFPPEKKIEPKIIPADMGVSIVYEHPDFLIINKPAGLLVHAPTDKAADRDTLTLVDWLVSQFKELSDVGTLDRPGIVHRLDKDTSGLMIIPRKQHVHMVFGDMFRNREIKKTYLAVVEGHPSQSGTIDFPIARHPTKKTRMTHTNPLGRQALTHYTVRKYFKTCTLVEAYPVTGRTHQIRVHFSGMGHPLMGDVVYGKKSPYIKRQALHAAQIAFTYQGENYKFESEPPEDFQKILQILSKEEEKI